MSPRLRLLAWLEVLAPAWIDRPTLRLLLEEAQAEAPDADLAEALAALDRGAPPDPACERFHRNHRECLGGTRCAAEEEQALLHLAARLPRWEWRGRAMAGLEGASGVEALEAVLEEAWEPYAALPVEAHRATAEAAVGHRLLHAGVQAAWDALALLRQGAPEEGLDLAEQAFRVLAAVRKLHERLVVVHGPERLDVVAE